MIKGRIEVNESGDLVLVIPEDVIQDLMLEEGEVAEWSLEDGFVSIYFG